MESIWSMEGKIKEHSALKRDISVNTVVIGAGMAGLLTAHMLQKKGIEVIVVEASEICSGQTKNTTAKITSQHGLIYSKIQKYYGDNAVAQYAAANEGAINSYRKIINDLNIDCEFEEQRAYLYSNDRQALTQEYLAAEKSGIDCYIENRIALPFGSYSALVFNNQAQFNPLEFARTIADRLTIYEKTPVTRIIDNRVYTKSAVITAENIVVATHYPFINFPSMYFLKMSQERSYAIALKNHDTDIDGIYIDANGGGLSLRHYRDMLIIGGEGHRTGCCKECDSFASLSSTVKGMFPKAIEVARWSAQDCITIDGLPYIGKFSRSNDRIYIATGFNKWGMTTSMAAARIISDMICGNKKDGYEIFSPSRFNFSASSVQIVKNTGETIKGFAGHIKKSNAAIENIKCNTAAEIKYNGQKAGAYKNEYGVTYVVSLTCPHLKCKLNWNNATKSWDCPCHGSRYSYKGELLDNPSQKRSILLAVVKNN